LNNLNTRGASELMELYQSAHPDIAMVAFNELYARYSARVYRYLMKKTRSKDVSDEVIQLTFLKLHESKHLYDNKYNFEQWIFIIAKTKLLDFLRANKRQNLKIEHYQENLSSDHFIAHISEQDEKDILDFFNLEDDQKELLKMKYLDELSYQEMAKKLGKTEISLRKSVSRVLARIKA